MSPFVAALLISTFLPASKLLASNYGDLDDQECATTGRELPEVPRTEETALNGARDSRSP
jgi:hypothetical protein